MSSRPNALVLLLAVVFGPLPAAANCVLDISDHQIPITTGFAGRDVLLFGTVEGPSDVVVTLRGPRTEVVMFRKAQMLGIWVNADRMPFKKTPSFFAMASSRPIEEIASDSERKLHQLGAEYLVDLPRARGSPGVRETWKQALLRNMADQGLYPSSVQNVTFLGQSLFRTRLTLPSNVPTGEYQASAFCLVDGKVQSAWTIPLFVEKVGVEAEIFDFAHNYSLLYGLIAVLLALMAGWMAHLAFGRS